MGRETEILPQCEISAAYKMSFQYIRDAEWFLSHVFGPDGIKRADWNVMVAIRDPAERLESGFLNKCVMLNAHTAVFCDGSHLERNQFDIFAKRMINRIQNANGSYPDMDYHFAPQWTNEGLSELYPRFVDTVLTYDRTTIGQQTLQYLKENGLEHLYYGWGPHGNQTFFVERTKLTRQSEEEDEEKKDALESDCAFYREFYDEGLLDEVMKAYKSDYEWFGLDGPAWKECIKNDEKKRNEATKEMGK